MLGHASAPEMAGRHCGVPPWLKLVAHTMGWNNGRWERCGEPREDGRFAKCCSEWAGRRGLWSYRFPSASWFCAPNTHLQMEEMGHRSQTAKGLIAPCDVLAVLVDRPAKLKNSALSALSIGLIPSSGC